MTDITDEQIKQWAVEATAQIEGADRAAAERGLMAVPEMFLVFRRFAELARQDERKRCRKIAEEYARKYLSQYEEYCNGWVVASNEIAWAIERMK